ncbi:hypothetical protein BGZ58_006071 [Dissophora ornata]|nr:hypothetical protein BGZ58_006071 [Dissophora ornata]
MTDSDFEDVADFDVNDISNIMKDIDSANLALDAMEGRAEKLTASIMSLLKAQSQPNPYINTEPAPLDQASITATVMEESLSITTPDSSSTLSAETEQSSTKVSPPSDASPSHSAEEKSA